MAARRVNRNRRRWLAAALVVSLIASACGGGDDEQPSPAAETSAPAEPADSTPAPDETPATTEPAEGGAQTGEDQELLVAPVDTTTTTTPPDAGTEEAAASGTEEDVSTTEAGEPDTRRGGTLRVAVLAEGDGLNPAANNFSGPVYVTAFSLFDPLTYYDTQGNWVPFVAESWTKIGDGTQWQMRLREGIRFHDGTELDADDVVATFNAMLSDPALAIAFEPGFDADQPIVKIDEYTVQYRGVRPAGRLPIAFTSQLGMIMPSEWLEQAASDPALNQMPVGTGPFMIESRIPDEKTVLVRNPDYWAADMIDIFLDRIEIEPITDNTVAAQRLIAGELDLVVVSGADAILTLREAADQGVRTVENQRSEETLMILNSASPVFSDIRARKALTFATDQDLYLELIRQGTSQAAHTMFHPDLVWRNPDVVQETNMPEKAGPLVAAHCADFPTHCTDGRIDMRVGIPGPSVEADRTVDLLVATWGEFFNLETKVAHVNELIVDIVLGNFDAALAFTFGAVDPDNDAIFMECGSVGFIALNFARYCDPERDELLYEQRRIGDLDRRVEIWHRIQEINRDSYTYIFLAHDNWTIGVRDNVQNLCGQIGPTGDQLFCNNQGRVWLNQLWLS